MQEPDLSTRTVRSAGDASAQRALRCWGGGVPPYLGGTPCRPSGARLRNGAIEPDQGSSLGGPDQPGDELTGNQWSGGNGATGQACHQDQQPCVPLGTFLCT